jgi:uncharacterized Zn finger protein
MICEACGKEWDLQQAHVVQTLRTTHGHRETILCPNCGHLTVVHVDDREDSKE